MIFLAIVYVLCVFYIMASYYTMEDQAYHIIKVAVLLPVAAILIAIYFVTAILTRWVPKAVQYEDWLYAKLDKLEKVIKNER